MQSSNHVSTNGLYKLSCNCFRSGYMEWMYAFRGYSLTNGQYKILKTKWKTLKYYFKMWGHIPGENAKSRMVIFKRKGPGARITVRNATCLKPCRAVRHWSLCIYILWFKNRNQKHKLVCTFTPKFYIYFLIADSQ